MIAKLRRLFGGRRRVLNPGAQPVLGADISRLAGDELLEVAPGRFVRPADLMGHPDEIEVLGADDA
jgi:hypothetical protein